MDATIARRTWRTLEPIHGAIYFAPEAFDEYRTVGIDDRMRGYFASRSAAMGAVDAAVVVATFFNFDPALVTRSMDGVWDEVSPSDMLAARLRAADRMIRRLGGELVDAPETAEAAELARIVATAACDDRAGRPLFAGHAALAWPDEPHLVLWHAQTLLREYRGDGHIVALVCAGLSGCEALVTHAAAGDVPAAVLQATRQRTDEDWAGAVDRLTAAGWLGPDGTLTDRGRAGRNGIEAQTDALSVLPYAALGDDRCQRLRELARPLSRRMATALG